MVKSIAGIILAAGKGTRMQSSLPKVLHEISGQPMLNWVFDTLEESGIKDICVILSNDLDGFEVFLEKNKRCQLLSRKSFRYGRRV